MKRSEDRDDSFSRKGFRGRPLLIVAALVVAGFGIGNLAVYFKDLISSRKTTEEIRQIYYSEPTDTPAPATEAPVVAWITPQLTPVMETPVVVTETPAPGAGSDGIITAEQTAEPRLESVGYPGNPDLVIDNRFKHLRTQSKYIIGWLKIDRLIDEAVVQRDNDYFLDHDIYGKENVNGAIFLDVLVKLEKQPFGYLVYGHNMKTGEKFGVLRNYENTSFYHENPYISFETMYESAKYVIFSVGNISTEETDRNYVDVYALISPEIQARQKAIDGLKEASVYKSAVDVVPEDQFLLLITCVDRDADRRIVAARRVRNGENEEELMKQVKLSGK